MVQIPDAPWVQNPEKSADEYYHLYLTDEEEEELDDDPDYLL